MGMDPEILLPFGYHADLLLTANLLTRWWWHGVSPRIREGNQGRRAIIPLSSSSHPSPEVASHSRPFGGGVAVPRSRWSSIGFNQKKPSYPSSLFYPHQCLCLRLVSLSIVRWVADKEIMEPGICLISATGWWSIQNQRMEGFDSEKISQSLVEGIAECGRSHGRGSGPWEEDRQSMTKTFERSLAMICWERCYFGTSSFALKEPAWFGSSMVGR